MSTGVLSKVQVKTAAEICRKLELDDDAVELLNDKLTPRQYLDLLVQHEHYSDAAGFLAHSLPKREAIWWACVCTRQFLPPKPTPQALAALAAAEKWVSQPTDENRRATFPAAEQADFGTPAGCAALAAFFSGGSLAPPGAPEAPPDERVTPDAVAGAVVMVGTQDPEKTPERFKKLFALGIDVANGVNKWK